MIKESHLTIFSTQRLIFLQLCSPNAYFNFMQNANSWDVSLLWDILVMYESGDSKCSNMSVPFLHIKQIQLQMGESILSFPDNGVFEVKVLKCCMHATKRNILLIIMEHLEGFLTFYSFLSGLSQHWAKANILLTILIIYQAGRILAISLDGGDGSWSETTSTVYNLGFISSSTVSKICLLVLVPDTSCPLRSVNEVSC